MSLWDSLFGHLSQPIAQILLTRNDIADVSLTLVSQAHSSSLAQLGAKELTRLDISVHDI